MLAEQGDIDGARSALQQAIDSNHPDYTSMAEDFLWSLDQ